MSNLNFSLFKILNNTSIDLYGNNILTDSNFFFFLIEQYIV